MACPILVLKFLSVKLSSRSKKPDTSNMTLKLRKLKRPSHLQAHFDLVVESGGRWFLTQAFTLNLWSSGKHSPHQSKGPSSCPGKLRCYPGCPLKGPWRSRAALRVDAPKSPLTDSTRAAEASCKHHPPIRACPFSALQFANMDMHMQSPYRCYPRPSLCSHP